MVAFTDAFDRAEFADSVMLLAVMLRMPLRVLAPMVQFVALFNVRADVVMIEFDVLVEVELDDEGGGLNEMEGEVIENVF